MKILPFLIEACAESITSNNQPLPSMNSNPLSITLAILFCGLTPSALAAAPVPPLRPGLPDNVTNSIYYQRWLWHQQDRLLEDGRMPRRARSA